MHETNKDKQQNQTITTAKILSNYSWTSLFTYDVKIFNCKQSLVKKERKKEIPVYCTHKHKYLENTSSIIYEEEKK